MERAILAGLIVVLSFGGYAASAEAGGTTTIRNGASSVAVLQQSGLCEATIGER